MRTDDLKDTNRCKTVYNVKAADPCLRRQKPGLRVRGAGAQYLL